MKRVIGLSLIAAALLGGVTQGVAHADQICFAGDSASFGRPYCVEVVTPPSSPDIYYGDRPEDDTPSHPGYGDRYDGDGDPPPVTYPWYDTDTP